MNPQNNANVGVGGEKRTALLASYTKDEELSHLGEFLVENDWELMGSAGTAKYLKEHNIEFTELDVASDEAARKEMIEKSGQMGAPVIEINGEWVTGFDKAKIEKLLKIER